MIFFFSQREFLTALILRVSLMGLLQPDTLDFMSSFEVGVLAYKPICDPARRFQAEVAKNENRVIACIRKANS